MSAFPVQIKFAVGFFIKVYAPTYQSANALGRTFNHLPHGFRITDIVAGHHRIVNMLLKVVHNAIRHGSYAALRFRSVGFFNTCFTDKPYCSFS